MRWSSFYTSTEKIKLQLVLKDKDRPSLEVFLKLKIERASIVIRTRQDLLPPQVSPITLSFGSAKLLNGQQMLEYFRPENLEVEGLDPAFLTQGGTLPDGLYSVSITAYEYDPARGHRQVSNTGYGFFAVYLGLPPIIQAPKDGDILPEMAVQNIMFQWLPRTAALPGGDGTQAYQFELFEVGPGEDPQQVANGSLAKVYTTTTSQPYLLYNPALANAPPLKPGGQYAIRVRVVSTDPSQGYQNDGYSQVVSFSYGTPCLPPKGISMALSNYLYDKISWLPQPGATGYTVQYKTNDATEWQSQDLFINFFENYNPKQAKTYQYKVMSRCSDNRTSEPVSTSRSLSIKPTCQPPTDIVVTQTDQPNTVKLSWAAVAGAKDYTLNVKKGLLQGADEYTTDKVTKDITYTSKSFNADIRTNCTNGTSSSYISASQYIPTSQQVKQASQEAFLKSVEPTADPSNPIDILNPFDIVVNSEGVTDEQVEAEIEKIKNPNEAIQTPCGAAKITETECDPVPNNYSGTETFAPSLGKYMYINGYEILITSPTEGLLYLPLIKSRVPVEWSGLTVKKGPSSADYGCITAGQVQMQGSQSGEISGDLYRQVMALLTQGPGSFSGKFGEALEAAKKLADELLAKIASGTPITPDEIAKYKGVCKAVKTGINAYKTEVEAQIPAPRSAMVNQAIADLESANIAFQELVDCPALGFKNNFDIQNEENFGIQKGPFGDFPIVSCNLAQGKASAIKVTDAVSVITLLLTPSQEPTNGRSSFACFKGTKFNLTIGEGVVVQVSDSSIPPVWTLNNIQYYVFADGNLSSLTGFYSKSEVDVIKSRGEKITSVKLESVSKFTNYTLGTIEENSSTCILKATDFDPNSKGDYFTEAGWGKLQQKLQKQGADDTEIQVLDCTKSPPTIIKTIGKDGQTDISQNKKVVIKLCWDGTKYDIQHDFKDGALQPKAGYNGSVADIEAESDRVADRVKQSGIPATTSGDGELRYDGLGFLEALVEVKEATLDLCNNAKVPEKYWQDGVDSPIKAPTLSGVGDGAIDELKSIPDLVAFGLQIATEPDVAKSMWNSIKTLTPAKVKKMLIGAGAEKLDKYSSGGNTMKHEVGKDGVQIAMFVIGGVSKIKDATELIDDLGEAVVEKLDDIAGESLEEIGGAIEEIGGKSFNKALKEVEIDNFVAESYSSTVADAAKKKGRKLSWEEVLAFFKRGNDFNKKGVSTYGGNFSEIHLGNKKRLDTYIPGQKIISRKATDIDNISEQTWRNYCNELVTKYKVGTPVNSTKLVNEPPLSGKYYLEIPSSNQSASKLQQFRDIAKQYGTDNDGIEIIFLNE